MTTKTRVVLTLEQQEEARRLVAHVLDKGGEAVLETAQKLLLARYADTLEVEAGALRSEVAKRRTHEAELRERVAELEREKAALLNMEPMRVAREAESRATAAEAQCRRLELRCCSAARSVACSCAGHWVCDTHGDSHEPGPKAQPAPAELLVTVGTLVEAVLQTRQHGDGSSLFLTRDGEEGPEVLSAENLERLCAAATGGVR